MRWASLNGVIIRQILFGCSAILAFSFAAAGLAAKYLDKEQVREVLSGNTIESMAGNWRVYYHPDGRISGEEGGLRDSGSWEVTDEGAYCVRWDNWVDGRRFCFKVERDGKLLTRKQLPGGTESKVKLLEGNPAGL